MPYQATSGAEPTRDEIDGSTGPMLLEFGASWCPHCQGVQGVLRDLLAAKADVQHIKVEDGKGKPLGRSFAVKLWPTLVFLRDGKVLDQVSRPEHDEIRRLFAKNFG